MLSAQKKFEYLQEMGIELWKLRASTDEEANQSHGLSVEQAFVTTQFFSDILRHFDLTIDDIIVAKNIIHIKQLKWQFSDEDKFVLQDNKLTTPTLSKIATSVALKKALWQTLSKSE